MAVEPLDAHRDLEEPPHLLVGVPHLGEPLLARDRLLEAHRMGGIVGDELGHLVDLAVGHAEDAAHVAHGGARLQCAEGDDLRDAIGAVFRADVGDHLVAPLLAEIDVEIRHRDALGVEEALEEKPEADRVEVGDHERPGDHRSGARAAAWPDRNPLRLGPLDEVGHDQEVAGEPHAGDHRELVFEPLGVSGARGLVPPLQPPGEPGARHRGERRVLVRARRELGKARQHRLLRLRHHRA